VRKLFFCITIFFISYFHTFAETYYVATDGNDTNPGTMDEPFATIPMAVSLVAPGDTIFVRGGTYNLIGTIEITAVSSGTDADMITLSAYNDEVPLLDFSGQTLGDKGISFKANYWHIIGLQIKGAGDNGMELDFASNNIVERCAFYENRDTGLQLSNGSANNRIINCDSYYNADPPDYADADGFAPKLRVGSGNYFYGCRAWGNSDDGWDGYLRGADDVSTTLENCWTWGNGYLKDGSDPGSQANGNGFKMGGGDNGNIDLLMHHNTLINCVAFDNKNKGFDQNNNVGSMTLLNCTGFRNEEANYRIQRPLNSGETLTIKNSVSLDGRVQLGSFAVQETNSWLPGFDVTADDFRSLDAAMASAPRQADGSLPEIDFLHLAQNSDLIDAGVDVGLPFNGPAPDLGAFESDFTTSVEEENILADFRLYQNYPNPFNPSTTIQFRLHESGPAKITIYNALGHQITTLFDGYLNRGLHSFNFDARDLASGLYLYKIETRTFSQVQKMTLLR